MRQRQHIRMLLLLLGMAVAASGQPGATAARDGGGQSGQSGSEGTFVLAVSSSSSPEGDAPSMEYYRLLLDDQTLLDLDSLPEDTKSQLNAAGPGARIKVHGTHSGGRINVDSTQVLLPWQANERARGGRALQQTSGFSVITKVPIFAAVVSICNFQATTTPAALSSLFFSTPGANLKDWFNECSHGQAVLDQTNSIVWPNVINIPCNAPGLDTTACQDSLYADYVMNYLKANAPTALAGKEHVGLRIPSNTACPWPGLGYIGKVFYNSANNIYYSRAFTAMDSLEDWAHELGHNNRLQHASTPGANGQEYGDLSCIMGAGTGALSCPNTPHRWQLGWDSPLPTSDLSATTLPIGTWQEFVLSNIRTSSGLYNFIRVNTNWDTSSSTGTYYIAYRKANVGNTVGYFDKISQQYTGVAIQRYAGVNQGDSVFTYYIATIPAAGQQWAHAGSAANSLVVKARAILDGVAATVRICRRSQATETSCIGGLDEDCNGLVDTQDPACTPAPSTVLVNNAYPPSATRPAMRSNNLNFALSYQPDGNLVLYQVSADSGYRAYWASNTVNNNAGKMVVQGDGNLVLYNGQGNPYWATNTCCGASSAQKLVLQDDGNLVFYGTATIYSFFGIQTQTTVIWASNTVISG